jgi:hypothetical protein
MLLRIVRARARSGMGAELLAHARGMFEATPAPVAGMVYAQAGTRIAEDGTEHVVILSCWESLEAFAAVAGPDLERPHLDDRTWELVEDATVEYFEIAASKIGGQAYEPADG